MDKKKGIAGFAFGALISALPLASALTFDEIVSRGPSDFISSIQQFFTPIFEAIIGSSSTEFFFAKVLLLLLLFVVINAILRRLPFLEDNGGVGTVIAAIVSILSVRFISENQLTSGILLPYGTLGVVLTTIIPFFVVFFVLHFFNIGSIGRRLTWLFFAIAAIALWFTRSDLPPVLNQIYGWTAVAVILVMIFDRGIHRYFAAWELNLFYRGAHQKTIAALQAEYLNIANVDSRVAEHRRDAIERQLHALGGDIP